MRYAALIIYLSIGFGVVAAEAKAKPGLMDDAPVFLLGIALWPAFPAARLYQHSFPDMNKDKKP